MPSVAVRLAQCTQSGIYESSCSDKLQIALSKGDTFPPCGKHGAVAWRLIRPTYNQVGPSPKASELSCSEAHARAAPPATPP